MTASILFEIARVIVFAISLLGLDDQVGRGLIGYLWLLIGHFEDTKETFGSYGTHFKSIIKGKNNWRKLMLLLLIISTSVNCIVLAKYLNWI